MVPWMSTFWPWTRTVPLSVSRMPWHEPLRHARYRMIFVIFIYLTRYTYLKACPVCSDRIYPKGLRRGRSRHLSLPPLAVGRQNTQMLTDRPTPVQWQHDNGGND